MESVARYSEVSRLVARLHGVGEERLTALRGRLQHLQKLGFPPGVNTGRGRPAEYGPSQVLMLILILEFMAVGLAPERAVRLLRQRESEVKKATRLALPGLLTEKVEAVFLRLEPAALFDEDPAFGYATAAKLDEFLRISTHLTGFTRHVLINLTALLRHLVEWAADRSLGTEEEFVQSLENWTTTPGGAADVD
jgi:hypothetical protein